MQLRSKIDMLTRKRKSKSRSAKKKKQLRSLSATKRLKRSKLKSISRKRPLLLIFSRMQTWMTTMMSMATMWQKVRVIRVNTLTTCSLSIRSGLKEAKLICSLRMSFCSLLRQVASKQITPLESPKGDLQLSCDLITSF